MKKGMWTLEQLDRASPEAAAKLRAEMAGATSLQKAVKAGPWSTAEPTVIRWRGGTRRFASKTEARVAERLAREAELVGARLYCQVRVPLLSIDPTDKGGPLNFTCDFVLCYPDGTERWIDAKGRKSPEWLRGKLAAQAWLGLKVEEVDC